MFSCDALSIMINYTEAYLFANEVVVVIVIYYEEGYHVFNFW